MNRNSRFRRLYRVGTSYAERCLVLYAKPNRFATNCLGITVTKKVGKAVVRNRVRRLIKENYRLAESRIQHGYDLIFVARVRASEASFWEIQRDMLCLLERAHLLREDETNETISD